MKFRKIIVSILIITSLIFITGMQRDRQKQINVIIPKMIYCGEQLNNNALSNAIISLHLKSIMTLCTPSKEEMQLMMNQSHLNYYILNFNSKKLSSKRLIKILSMRLSQAPLPILIVGCHNDTMRLAAAMSVILFNPQQNIKTIKQQLSHTPTAIDYQVMTNYFHWLETHHFASSKMHFMRWISEH